MQHQPIYTTIVVHAERIAVRFKVLLKSWTLYVAAAKYSSTVGEAASTTVREEVLLRSYSKERCLVSHNL